MPENYENKTRPLVTVLLPTFNRPQFLPVALSSILRQDYANLEIFVINDGGVDVSDIVKSFNDRRIIFINRKENRGLPYTLNEALGRATGKYVCYLGDDDLYYPHHVSTLLDILEGQDRYGAAYSDLYKTYCTVSQDGSRRAVSKIVEVSRDFDRFFMLYFNHTLNVSMMHRRDLFEKTGLYNEKLNILIDWDMTRRLVFYTDFYHTSEITGEFYSPVGESDRISVRRRKDRADYLRNVLAIRTTRPPKPWPKVKDMSIIFTSDSLDRQAGKTIGLIWRFTFYPYQLYLPLLQHDLNRLNTDMPNIVPVPVGPSSSQAQQVDAALRMCEGDYIAIVPSGFPVTELWVENSLYALINSRASHEAFQLHDSTDMFRAAVVKKTDLQLARRNFPNLTVRQSLEAAGITLRIPDYEELPFLFDDLLRAAQSTQKDGNWAKAAQMFGYIADHYQNELWMKSLAANAFYRAGDHTKAMSLAGEVNRLRPTVNTLLLEAKVNRHRKDFSSAVKLLERAEHILQGQELLWT